MRPPMTPAMGMIRRIRPHAGLLGMAFPPHACAASSPATHGRPSPARTGTSQNVNAAIPFVPRNTLPGFHVRPSR